VTSAGQDDQSPWAVAVREFLAASTWVSVADADQRMTIVAQADELLARPLSDLERALVSDRRASAQVHLPGEQRHSALRAAEALQRLGCWQMAAGTYLMVGVLDLIAGDVTRALDLSVRGVLAARVAAGQDEAEAAAVRARLSAYLPGAEDLAPEFRAKVHNQLAALAHHLFDFEEAARMCGVALEAGAEALSRPRRYLLRANLAEALRASACLPRPGITEAERQAILDQAAAVVRLMVEDGYGPLECDVTLLRADLASLGGRPEAAWAILSAVAAAPDHAARAHLPSLLIARGRCVRLLGRPVEATIELDAAVAAGADADRTEYLECLIERSSAWEEAGDLERAWSDADEVTRLLWDGHCDQVAGLFGLVWPRAGFEGERREIEALADTLVRAASRDTLTGVLNRRGLEQVLRDVDPLALVAVIVLDVDGFKAVNDREGHAAGDVVLQGVAAALRAAVGPSDQVARWGGEEFVVVSNPAHPRGGGPEEIRQEREAVLEHARALAERLRLVVQDSRFTVGPGLGVTISLGMCVGRARWWRELLARADAAMFEAKRAGRNRVVVAEQAAPAPAPGRPSGPDARRRPSERSN